MPDQDPLSNFLGDIAQKIKIAKEHKSIMDAVYASASGVKTVEGQEDPFANFLKKVGEAVSSKLPLKPVSVETSVDVEPKDDSVKELGEKIKNAIKKAKANPAPKEEPAKDPAKVELPEVKLPDIKPEPENTKELEPVKDLGQKIKDAIEKAKNRALEPELPPVQPEDKQVAAYIDELEKIKDSGTVVQKEEATTTLKEIKEYIDKAVKDYSRRILELGSGGGSVAAQFADGGTMNGDLNVNGHILSGGKNIANYFGSGGGGGDPEVNAVVYTNSAHWNDAYTNLQTYSASYLLSGTEVYLGDIPTASGSWNSTYTTTNYFSAFWNAAVDELFNFYVTQTDPGSAFISEDGNYYIISNSKLDNVNLWNLAYTQVFLLSSQWDSVYVTVLGSSASWNSVYTSLNQNSAKYESVYSTTNSASASWSSAYSTYNALSASYAAETLAIAYAVAL